VHQVSDATIETLGRGHIVPVVQTLIELFPVQTTHLQGGINIEVLIEWRNLSMKNTQVPKRMQH